MMSYRYKIYTKIRKPHSSSVLDFQVSMHLERKYLSNNDYNNRFFIIYKIIVFNINKAFISDVLKIAKSTQINTIFDIM